MGTPSPYFIRPIDRESDITEVEFSAPGEEVEPWVKIQEYWRVFRKRLRLVLGITLTIIALVALSDIFATPIYTATTSLLINNNLPRLFPANGDGVSGEPEGGGNGPDDHTEYELLRSRSIAARVIVTEGLIKKYGERHPSGFLGAIFGDFIHRSNNSKKIPIENGDPIGENGVPAAAIDNYLSHLKVSPIEDTRMTRVSVTTSEPELSARLANAHARQFIRRGIELNAAASEDAERFLSGKLAELKVQVEQSELALNNYRRDKGIIPGLISVNGKEDVVLDRLNKISQDLQESHLKTISLGTEVALIKEGRADTLPEVIDSPLIQKLKGELDSLRVEYAGQADQFKPSYPPMQELQAKIAGTQEALSQEIRNAVSNVQEQYHAAEERERSLDLELDKQKSFALGLNDAAVRYLILEREADTNRELYNSVLKRMKDMALLADVHASNISVVDFAETPRWPSSPKISQDLLFATLFGLLVSLGLAFALEYLDATLKFPDEAQQYLRVPNLAVIPEFSFSQRLPYGAKRSLNFRSQAISHRNDADIVTTTGKYSILGESYRTLRTALLLSRAGNHPKVTLITSALPHEGKTTVAVNIAIVLAHTGAKVLLIDADLRKPRCHKVLSLKNHFGLTEILTGSANEDAVSVTKIDNLDLLSSGKIPPSPSELLGSSNMREIIESLSKKYDYIVVDSPPVMAVADPIVLSAMVDGVVLVAAGGQTPKQQVRAAIARLQQSRARIFGFVLNKIKINRFDYPYSHYSGLYNGYYNDSENPDEEGTEPQEDFAFRLSK